MIKSIKLYNRFNMDVFAETGGLNFPYNYWYLVSIYGEMGKPLITNKSKAVFNKLGLKGYVSLNFWDIDDKHFPKVKLDHPDATLFNEDNASNIIDLLDRAQKDTNPSTLVIHCQAGISRSGAVGTFACDYCGLDYSEFIKDNPGIYANQYVLNALRRKANFIPFSGVVNDGIDRATIDEHFGMERFERLVLGKRE